MEVGKKHSIIREPGSFIKSFDLRADGTGVWIDSELRPVLHGREFDWKVALVDGDEWNDVDLTLTFAEFDYTGKPTPTFKAIDTLRERRDFGLFKRYALPALYWHGMLRGRA